LKSGEHFLRIHIPMARVIFEDARCHSFSPPGFFAEIGDETAIASNLSDVIARASINLIAFGEVANLASVAGAGARREPHSLRRVAALARRVRGG